MVSEWPTVGEKVRVTEGDGRRDVAVVDARVLDDYSWIIVPELSATSPPLHLVIIM